jgi:hypothetical protein
LCLWQRKKQHNNWYPISFLQKYIFYIKLPPLSISCIPTWEPKSEKGCTQYFNLYYSDSVMIIQPFWFIPGETVSHCLSLKRLFTQIIILIENLQCPYQFSYWIKILLRHFWAAWITIIKQLCFLILIINFLFATFEFFFFFFFFFFLGLLKLATYSSSTDQSIFSIKSCGLIFLTVNSICSLLKMHACLVNTNGWMNDWWRCFFKVVFCLLL